MGFTWQLPANDSAPSTVAGTATAPSASLTFERRGLLMPFQRDQKSDFANGSGAALFLSNARRVLRTPRGALRWRPSFGSDLHKLRHRNMKDPGYQQLAAIYTIDALADWEPRVIVRDVAFERIPRGLRIKLRVDIAAPQSAGRVLLFEDVPDEFVVPLAA